MRAVSADGGSEVIIVVEDDEVLRTYTVRALIELGYKALFAVDTGAALGLVQS